MQSTRKLVTFAATVALVAACGGGRNAGSDTAVAGAVGTDTGMAGMDHSKMPMGDSAVGGMAGMNHGMMKADTGFLAMMSDHHEGLIAMAMPAMNKAAGATTKEDAHKLHTKQAAERDTMVTMLRSSFGTSHTPTVMQKNRAQNDSLQALSGPEYDRKFYQLVVQHHREGVAMIDSAMSSLQNEKVREMASKMKQDQQREIQEFQRKAGG